jgi:ribonuclease HII
MMARFDAALLPPSPDLSLESAFWKFGLRAVCGIDEAGRGALAGPVSAGALVLPPDLEIGVLLDGLQESKSLSSDQRSRWAALLKTYAQDWAVGFADSLEIDLLGIIQATRLAVQRALDRLKSAPEHLMLDYLFLPENPLPQTSLIKGDARCLSIAGASILAKTARDRFMQDLHECYPSYGLGRNKGYGTEMHRRAILENGPSPIHRRSFTLPGVPSRISPISSQDSPLARRH